MKMGAETMCIPSPSIDQFVDVVKHTAIANKRWVPPAWKGSLYLRHLLMGSGQLLGLGAAPEYVFLIHVSPVGNYFKELKTLAVGQHGRHVNSIEKANGVSASF